MLRDQQAILLAAIAQVRTTRNTILPRADAAQLLCTNTLKVLQHQLEQRGLVLQTRISQTAARKTKLLDTQEASLESYLAAIAAAVTIGEAALETGNSTRALIETAETLRHADAINPLNWPLQSVTAGRFHFLPFEPVPHPHAVGSVAAEIGDVVDEDIRASACTYSLRSPCPSSTLFPCPCSFVIGTSEFTQP